MRDYLRDLATDPALYVGLALGLWVWGLVLLGVGR